MRRRSSAGGWLRLAALAGLGLAAGLAAMAALALPRLDGHSPAAAATDVSTRARLQLTFSRPMDPASVAQALTITPDLPGDLAWDSSGTTLTFTPRQSWPVSSTVSVALAGGRSQLGLPVLGTASWSFLVGQERLVFLAGAAPNLAVISSLAEDGQPAYLTAEPLGVVDFTIRPDGGQIVYAARRADGGADLRAIGPDGGEPQTVLDCRPASCAAPVFSPRGDRLAYERQTAQASSAADFGDGRIHMLTLDTGQDRQVGGPDDAGRNPLWSPDGRLSYYDPGRQAVVLLDPDAGAATYIPATAGEAGTFSPDGQTYIFPEIDLQAQSITLTGTLAVSDNVPVEVTGFYSHLLRVTVASNAVQDLTGQGVVEDASPVYSGDGAWVAFGRRPIEGQAWQPGRQLWLMRPDGGDAHALTQAPEYHHTAFRWSPDGQRLAYMRFNAVDPNEPAEIWLIQADGAGARRVTTAGYRPEWLP